MEAKLELLLPGTLLEEKPMKPKAPLILRIAGTRPHGNLTAYDLRYIGLVPGKYDLRDYLVRKDGSQKSDLPAMPVEVAGVLPQQHRGELVPQDVRPLPFLGGYKRSLVLAGIVWIICLAAFWLWRKKPKTAQMSAPAITPPTLAERLQPLVVRAAEGKLSRDELAQLERMLLSHWRERLGFQQLTMVEAVQQLRQHPEGGALLRQLENWLHRPPGAADVDVSAMLAPYR